MGVNPNCVCDSSNRSWRDQKVDGKYGGESVKHASGKASLQKVGDGRGESGLRGGGESNGMTMEGGPRPRTPRNVTIRSVKEPSTDGGNEVTHEKPRGRVALVGLR